MKLFFKNYIVLHAESPSDAALLVDFMFSSLPKEQSFERIINAGTKHWLLFINKILVLQITYLLNHLIQLSKTGFSKATQRLDGIYAFFAVLRLAAVDTKAGFLLFRVLSKCQVLFMQVHFFP